MIPTDVQGTQITATREGKVKTRDSQRFKQIETPQPPKFRTLPSSLCESNTPDNYESDADVGPPRQQETRPSGSTHSAHEQGRLHPHQPSHITAAPAPQHGQPRKERWSLQPPEDRQGGRPSTRSLTRSRQESKGKGWGRK